MSVMRIHKTKNFTVMSNHHFKERKMSLKAKGLLSLMLSLPDDWNYSVAGLVKLSKDGKDSVMSALQELEKFGYLIRKKMINEKGQFNGIEYHIFEEPQQDIPVADNPILEKRKAAKPNAEEPPQLNKKELNINSNKILYDINNYIEVLQQVSDNDLRNLYVDFIDNRARLNDVITPKGVELLIERVRAIAGIHIEQQKSLLRTAIINNWKNVYSGGQEPNDYLEDLKNIYS